MIMALSIMWGLIGMSGFWGLYSCIGIWYGSLWLILTFGVLGWTTHYIRSSLTPSVSKKQRS